MQHRGPVITTAIGDRLTATTGCEGRGYYVQDAGFPDFLNWLMEPTQLRSVIRAAPESRFARSQAIRLFGERIRPVAESRDFGDRQGLRLLLLAGAGHGPRSARRDDVPRGRSPADRLDVGDLDRVLRPHALDDGAHRRAARREYADNPLWWAKRVITVHPLGGAPMGRYAQEGVVDSLGEVFGAEGSGCSTARSCPGPPAPIRP